MTWTLWGLAVQTVAGLLGAHAIAGAARDYRFGFVGHSVAGIVGGALSGAFLQGAAVTIVTGNGSQNLLTVPHGGRPRADRRRGGRDPDACDRLLPRRTIGSNARELNPEDRRASWITTFGSACGDKSCDKTTRRATHPRPVKPIRQ
ncbi:hypothetical protein [Bradyrhizobium jicamae]|uniref:hypothetical protein n=1 Tax=Bradyrhizobium jicamae TaxID=280332 RepID=UPI001BAC579E|nr:hypothetical protein [Bradyrhizobium jicamae]MBR0934022.1 hypothetical protein [Bradyrhizobium jicamae]